MARVCALNNYPLVKMWERAQRGQTPRQHLWGVDRLVAVGHTVDFAPFHEPGDRHPLARLSVAARGLLGHIDQEAYAVRRLRRLDIVYCADQIGLSGLGLAQPALGGVRLASVVHHPPGNILRRLGLGRQDVLLCLSKAVCANLRSTVGGAPTIVHLPWGPDLECPLYRPDGEGSGVVSAGKSNRDLPTLAQAMRDCGAGGLVYDLEHHLAAGEIPRNVRVVTPGHGAGVDPDSQDGFTTARVIADLAAAAIVAIPVRDPARLTGLTEAADALALGKPIVATRSPYFPFDIEAVGCGIWVEPGDVDGWRRALAGLLADPERRRAMGAAGRRYAERECNYEAFCDGLLGALSGG